MPERSADWMAQAERDLEVARHTASGGYYEWACFQCQQSTEKALKAVFQIRHGDVLGHSISGMLRELGNTDRAVAAAGTRLDRVYIQSRYPDSYDSGAPMDYFLLEDAQRAVEDAATIVQWAKSQIP